MFLCVLTVYMAPEIISGHEYDFKVDVWSLGVIFYEIASGDRADAANFHEMSSDASVSDKLSSVESNIVNSKERRRRLSLGTLDRFRRMDSNPETPIGQLIRMMLDRDPEARPSTSDVLKHLKLMGPVEDDLPVKLFIEMDIQKYEQVWERHKSREHTEVAMNKLKVLARQFKGHPGQDQIHTDMNALYEHSKQIAPELLRAMQEFVERHGGDFVCPPPVYKVERGAKVEEAQLRQTVKQRTAAQQRVRPYCRRLECQVDAAFFSGGHQVWWGPSSCCQSCASVRRL